VHVPGHYAASLQSPDGRWVAFTARHTYGPEDLFLVAPPKEGEQAAVTRPTATPAPAEHGIHTPEQLRQHIEDWPAAYKIVVDEDIVIRFAYPDPILDWAGSAFVDHIPSMSNVIFDYEGQVNRTRYESRRPLKNPLLGLLVP
jgi:hypothetical protein